MNYNITLFTYLLIKLTLLIRMLDCNNIFIILPLISAIMLPSVGAIILHFLLTHGVSFSCLSVAFILPFSRFFLEKKRKKLYEFGHGSGGILNVCVTFCVRKENSNTILIDLIISHVGFWSASTLSSRNA